MHRHPWSERVNLWGVYGVMALFIGFGMVAYWDARGDDLGSSYIGCRLLATGNAPHLYSYDPDDFADVGGDEAWQAAADWGEFDSYQHPYVQTPLWAYALRPVCGTKFVVFRRLFQGAVLVSFALCLWLVGRFWTPSLLTPVGLGAVAVCLWFSEPFRYSMYLMQTHILFLLPAIAGLILAERRRPGWAGLLLACAAAVKVTPGVLVLYWLLTKRWKAALSAVLWSVALMLVTLATTGWPLMSAYLADLHRISRVLLLAYNNQSVAAWWLGGFHPEQVNEFNILPLPAAMRIGSMALMVGLTVVGGLLDRRKHARDPKPMHGPPFGAMIALIAATLCAPIAWTHYSIVLIAPLMMLWQEGWQRRSLWIMGAVMFAVALNCQPLSTNMADGTMGPFTLVRSEFYAEVWTLGVLAAVAWMGARAVGIGERKAKVQSADLYQPA